MYYPSDDTFFLASIVSHFHGNFALEIGTSSGTILRELSKNFNIAVGTDIDFCSLKRLVMTSENSRVICCDAASALCNVKFDLVVFNPPYLPNTLINADKRIDGGPAGIEVSIHFIKSTMDKLTNDGKILFLISDLTDTKKLAKFISKNNLSVTRVAQKELFYERLQIFEISP